MKKTLLLTGYIILGIGLIIFFQENKNNNTNSIHIPKSIVQIIPKQKVLQHLENPKGIFQKELSGGIGTGFFVSKDGIVMTAKHVVSNKEELYTVLTHDKKAYDGKVIFQDTKKDIALLKIDLENTTALKLNNQTKVGEDIVTYGNDKETGEIIARYGEVTKINKEGENSPHSIEISAKIQEGFSGGPVLNKKQEVIGINYGILNQIHLITPVSEDPEQFYQ